MVNKYDAYSLQKRNEFLSKMTEGDVRITTNATDIVLIIQAGAEVTNEIKEKLLNFALENNTGTNPAVKALAQLDFLQQYCEVQESRVEYQNKVDELIAHWSKMISYFDKHDEIDMQGPLTEQQIEGLQKFIDNNSRGNAGVAVARLKLIKQFGEQIATPERIDQIKEEAIQHNIPVEEVSSPALTEVVAPEDFAIRAPDEDRVEQLFAGEEDVFLNSTDYRDAGNDDSELLLAIQMSLATVEENNQVSSNFVDFADSEQGQDQKIARMLEIYEQVQSLTIESNAANFARNQEIYQSIENLTIEFSGLQADTGFDLAL